MSVYGIFENQPVHLLDHVLPKVPYSDLRSLALTSSTWYCIVKQYVNSTRFQSDSAHTQDFCDLGRLIGTVSYENGIDIVRNLAMKIWKAENSTASVGKLIHGFCSCSSESASRRVSIMFEFMWNLIGSLEGLIRERVRELVEHDAWDDDLDEGEFLKENEKKNEVRRQLCSLFFPDTSSATHRFFLIELIRKLRNIAEDDVMRIVSILHIILDPILTFDDVEFIDSRFDSGFDIKNIENFDSLEPMAKAFKGLQKSCSSDEETEFCKKLFHAFMDLEDETIKAALLAQEPSLLSWYIQDHSFLVIMGSGVANVLMETALVLIRQKSPKIDEFQRELGKIREATLKEINGKKHWAKLQKRIIDSIPHSPRSRTFKSLKLIVLH